MSGGSRNLIQATRILFRLMRPPVNQNSQQLTRDLVERKLEQNSGETSQADLTSPLWELEGVIGQFVAPSEIYYASKQEKPH